MACLQRFFRNTYAFEILVEGPCEAAGCGPLNGIRRGLLIRVEGVKLFYPPSSGPHMKTSGAMLTHFGRVDTTQTLHANGER